MNTNDKPDLDIKFTDIDAFIASGTGEAYHFEYAGKKYTVERWATRNSSGEDIYDADTGDSAYPFNEEESEAFDELLAKVVAEYMQHWQTLVQPALQTAVERTLARVNQTD